MKVTGRRTFAGLAVLALLFAAIVLVSLRAVHALEAPPDRLEQKLVAAERYLYYRAFAERGPGFELAGDERKLRFVSHALVPAGSGAYDPARALVYGLRLDVVAGGKTVWSHDVYARSRQSKARRVADHGGLWLDENAFSLEPGVEVTDDRQTIVQLPADLPAGAVLRVRLVGEPKEALVRVYAEVERSRRRRELLLRKLSPGEREAIADRVSYVPWDRLAFGERLARLRWIEQRLPAAGKEGVDYQTRVLYFSGFRQVAPDDAPERGVLVTPERAAAFNVVGPAQLTLALHRPAAAENDRSAHTLELRSLGEGAAVTPYQVDVPAGGTQVLHPVQIAAGVHTLELSTTAPLGVLVEVTGPPTQMVALTGGAPGAAVVPDTVQLPAYLTGPEGEPVRIAVSGPDDPLGRALRLDVRLVVAPGATDGEVEQGGNLWIETIDAAGTVLASTRTPIASVRTPFEQLSRFGKQLDGLTEPVTLRYVVPRGGHEVRVHTSRPAALRLYAPVSLAAPPDLLASPFADVPLATLVWRYARYLAAGWQPLRALNHATLAPERTATVVAQTRLEAPPPPEPPATTLADALAPEGGPERQTVLERVQPEDAARVRADWGAGDYLKVTPGAAQALDFTGGPSRPKIQYWVLGRGDDALGESAELFVDGQSVDKKRFVTTHGTWDLPRGLAGPHTLLVRTRAASVRLLVDRPPVGGGELYALRTIYKSDRRLRVRVPKGAAPIALDIMVYARDAAADAGTTFRVSIDGGAPRRVEGVALAKWTTAERTLSLPAADREPTLGFANVAERGKLYPRLLVIGLGDDLPPGGHTVEIQAQGRGPGWARFFVLSGRHERPDQAIQWRVRDEGPSEGSSE
jgi:hypothetical protein